MKRLFIACLVLALLATSCGDDDTAEPTPTSSSTTTSTSTTTTSTTTTTSSSTTTTTTSPTTTTEAPTPECVPEDAFAALDAALVDARLEPGGAWSLDVSASAYAAETADPVVWAGVLGLDCAVQAT